jgi:class 3 adenylate cyclase/tetratricopeptide (TPR) repeat protein
MKCPECQTENPETRKFCRKCGAKLLIICPQCGLENLPEDNFCGECGQRLKRVLAVEEEVPEAVGERKHITVLFSDLSGYTALSEKLDPEDLKEVTTNIFSQISKVIDKYEGFVEKFVGDAVMALFGVPKAHEDDPIRAIRAAREMHELVDASSPELEKRIGQPISMHTGINTGLVVTGEVDMERGTHGVAGETINLASRLSSLAEAGEILVGPDTYRQAEGHFTFESLEPTMVKGKAEPIQVHKVLSAKEKPLTIHRLSGLRADLIGRKAEITQLNEAVENLRKGKGSIFSIYGDAGTGKSRLVEDFKNTLNLEEMQWIEGHAYAYSQNVPYFPLIDLLNRVLQIEEDDLPEVLREKVESGIEDLVGKRDDLIPYLGSLYSLRYPELENVNPELWRSRLQEAAQNIISALAKRAQTIFFLEDLHWADPSFVELIRNALLHTRQPAIVLCVYRPIFSLFTSHQLSGIANIYQEIQLQDLSPSEAQDMLESLLKTETIPSDLKRFIQQKAEGNPFYLEELVNSLIESETLIRDNGNWRATKPITESDISSTIHGLISGRLDRLERETKRILQEASVIGRAFLYDILKRITELEGLVDLGLSTLERLDLIRTRSIEPDLEYIFKHPLTQEVVYNGLLKKERQTIHEQIALVMEQLFQDRLFEFYETLAFHFSRGRSVIKAVDYLVKSGEKSLAKYAVEEAHQYFKEAFEILAAKTKKTKKEKVTLVDILNSWGYAFFYLGDFKKFIDLLNSHKDLAESLEDKARLGMFYAWFGVAFYLTGKIKDSYEYLRKALDLGERSGNQKVVGYACTFLPWPCSDMGLFQEGTAAGERAQEIAKSFPSDQYLSFKSLSGLAFLRWQIGDLKSAIEDARSLLRYGQRNSNHRSLVMGHYAMASALFFMGDMPSTIKSSQNAINVSEDPFYSQVPRLILGGAYLMSGRLTEAEEVLQEIMDFHNKFDIGIIANLARIFLGAVKLAKGDMNQGLRMIEEGRRVSLENHIKSQYIISEYILGKVYLQMVQGEGTKSASVLAKNVGFMVKNVPFASKKAENHLTLAIEVAEEIGAKGILGQVYLDLGLLYKAKKRKEQARKCFSESIQLFEQCEAEVYLKQAKEALASLE